MRPIRLLALTLLLVTLGTNNSKAQDVQPYSVRQSFSAFAEYSNTSSHIILGVSQDRRFMALGLTYSLRLVHTRYADWHYAAEIRPLTLLEDPVTTLTILSPNSNFSQSAPTSRACYPGVYTLPPDPASGFPGFTYRETCSTRWTYAGGISPLGQRINILPRNRLQPFLVGNAGFLVSPRDVPVNNSSRFNFTFEFGAGFEFFHDRHHSWSAEYRIHHLSNAYTGNSNPGIDSQIIKLTCSFAR
jgi:hypothetical protein